MSPATWPRDDALAERLLHIDPVRGTFRDARVGDLPGLLRAGDLVVVNDGATLPASLAGTTAAGAPIEARLVEADATNGRFRALLFGAGDWHSRTEDRPLPPRLAVGEALAFGPALTATIVEVSPASPRLVVLAFREEGARLWDALYRHGRPIQYAYLAGPLALFHVQTRYASRPWCAELASAGRPLTWSVLLALGRKGVELASLTHAAGLSSTGEPALDALLPLRERFDIPEETVAAIARTKARGGRVVAIGTTVARALEGCASLHGGALVAGIGTTELVLGAGFTPKIVDGLFTGVHEPSASHYRLLAAFAPEALVARAHEHAAREGYLCHEFGDSSLILAAA